MTRIHTAADLAQMFHKPIGFVKKQAAAGTWPAFKVGQEWRFTDDDVTAITRIGRRSEPESGAPILVRSRGRRKAAS